MRYDLIKEEMLEIKKKFGDERKTQIEYLATDISIEDLIEDEDVVITVSHLGYIKRTSATEYRSQKRGGRGAMGGKTREEDYIDQLFIASTHATLLFFTKRPITDPSTMNFNFSHLSIEGLAFRKSSKSRVIF
jgi:DNA gyrase subunit A